MYTTVPEFLRTWAYETKATLKIFQALTDPSLEQRVNAGGRSLGQIAWHLTLTMPEMMGHAGLKVSGPREDAPVPGNAAEIVRVYADSAEVLGEMVGTCWSDAMLGEEVEMYGEIWKRGFVLTALVQHQIHHRGQMTVLMRQAGLAVPGLYGPSREEWAAMNLPAPW